MGSIITGTTTVSVTVQPETIVEIGTVTLTSGIWIVVGACDWGYGETGYRQIAFASSINPTRQRAVTTMTAGASKETYQQTVMFLSTSGETVSLYGLHNHSEAVNAYPYVYAIKVGNR